MSFSLTAAIGCPFLALLLWIIKSSGPLWFWYAWGMMVAFTVLMLTVYPVFIMPLFNKYGRRGRSGASEAEARGRERAKRAQRGDGACRRAGEGRSVCEVESRVQASDGE
jgi:hypothetical protein